MITRFFEQCRLIQNSSESSQQSQALFSASLASQISPNTSESPTPSPAPSTPHRLFNPHANTSQIAQSPRISFPVVFDPLIKDGKPLKNPRLRPASKQSILRQDSFIWKHGIEIQDDDNERLWFCKICHKRKAYHEGIYVTISTDSSDSSSQAPRY